MDKDEIISAFAFDTGRKIENLIKEETNNLKHENQILEAKIMQWYMKDRNPEFAEHFGIKEYRSGNDL